MPECAEDKINLGVGKCNDLPKIIVGMITTPDDFSLTYENAALQASWQAAILASKSVRIYKWPKFSKLPEYTGTETTYDDNPISIQAVLDGKYRWKVNISKSLCFHKAAFSHRATSGRVILIDADGNYYGTKVGENLFGGFTLDMLHTENLQFNDGTVASSTPIVVALADPNEVNHSEFGILKVAAPWNNLLKVLTDVTITVVSEADDEIVVTIAQKCDGTPLEGLADDDFVLLETDGSSQTIAGITEDEGTYTITGSGFVSGTIGLVAPSELSIQAYEAEPATVTIAS